VLETVNAGARKMIKNGVEVIESGRENGIGKKFNRICVKLKQNKKKS
jgi:hypothetical protein